MADSILKLRKLGINSKKELENYIKDSFIKRQELLDEMKEIDTKLVQIDKIVEAAHTINKYKKFMILILKIRKILFLKMIILKKFQSIKSH